MPERENSDLLLPLLGEGRDGGTGTGIPPPPPSPSGGGCHSGFFLGIDTGGTFTDAVLIDARKQVVASAKCLTTRFDLAQGIGAAIDKLPANMLAEVDMVSLSTTLTTNSVVEGKGSPVCVLLAGYDERQIKASGLPELLGLDCIVSLHGGHDAGGFAAQPLDEDAARTAILKHAPRVSAFAISASFGVRNPEHELQLRALVESLCERPVTCGHELASSLGAPRRAMTVALNARMISHVKDLIDAVKLTLAERGIDAPLMLVKGDGSLINVKSALQHPVSTVLSGPAASVLGACALSGHQDAIVADMGGTTTDIAVVRGGRPELSFDGALIGGWRPMIEAVRIYAIGLGGDSEVRFSGGEGLAIGPRRVVPLSLLVFEHPQLLPVLQRQQAQTPHGSQIRFALRLNADAAQISLLPVDEMAAWEQVCKGPVDMERANAENRPLSRSLARLERKGLVIYSGFTPSDAAHVLYMSIHWNREAAVLGSIIWARQMRHMYGLGTWPAGDAEAPARAVVDKVTDMICQKLIEAGLNDAGEMNESNAGKMAGLLTRMALHERSACAPTPTLPQRGREQEAGADPASPLPPLGEGRDGGHKSTVFQLQFAPGLPLVAVGAPAATFYPRVARGLSVPLVLPQHAAVANALGAVLGEVSQRVHVVVSQPVRGVFRVFTRQGPRDFPELKLALDHARQLASDEAMARALQAGAVCAEVQLSQLDNAVENDIDGNVFFEAQITATASGKAWTRSAMRRADSKEPLGGAVTQRALAA